MSRNINFPVKYAILELKEKGGYITNYKDIVKGYIVSKCWVVESSIKYYEDGDNKFFHKVIFPYTDLGDLKISLKNNHIYIGERNTPKYDYNYNPYPVNIVSELFDTYEEAKVKAEEKNNEMKHKLVLDINYDLFDPRFKPALTELEKEFSEELDICSLFERVSLLKSEDMNITDNLKLQLIKTKNYK